MGFEHLPPRGQGKKKELYTSYIWDDFLLIVSKDAKQGLIIMLILHQDIVSSRPAKRFFFPPETLEMK